MSYILDALKKAERERDIRQVPTLMAEHESGAKRGKLPWVVFGSVAICAGAILWLTLLLQRTINSPEPSLTGGESGSIAKKLESAQSGASTASALPGPKTEYPNERSNELSRAAPHAVVPVIPPDFPQAKTIDNMRLQQMAGYTASTARQGEEVENASPTEMIGRQPPQMSVARRASPVNASAAAESKEKPASLKEALNEMTLSVLVYDENKADRMVFINGRKYVEGDYIEDAYFLESITLEGAVLTYLGERAILRPKAK